MEVLLPEIFDLVIDHLVSGDLYSCFSLARCSKHMKSMVYRLIVRSIQDKKLTIMYRDTSLASGEVRTKHNIPKYIKANYMTIYNGTPVETCILCKYNSSGVMVSKHQLIPSLLIAIYSKPHRNRKVVYRSGMLVKSVNNDTIIKYHKRIDVFSVCAELGLNVGLEGTNETAFRIVISKGTNMQNSHTLSVHTGYYWKPMISW